MQFTLSDEQQMLTDSVARFTQLKCSFEARKESIFRGGGSAAENWRTFAENGWLGAALPVEAGGFGGGAVEAAIISEQLGQALVLDPWLGSGLMALQLLAADAERTDLLQRAIEGTERVALAYSEPGARRMPWVVATSATRTATGWQLDGHKTLVMGGVGADQYIVSARISGALADEAGIALFLVPARAPGLRVTPTPLHDDTVAAELKFCEVRDAQLLTIEEPHVAALERAVAYGIVGLCAELVGVMARAIEITAEYLHTRKQFGVALATFQSLQHRMADMAAELELARSMLFAAIAALENDHPQERRATLSSAKMLVTEAARNVCGEAIQLHGGIGMTDEYTIGHYFKRAIVADALLGGRLAHEAVVAASIRERVTRAA